MDDYTIDCTGDVVAGDTVLFVEAVWRNYKPGRKARKLGERQVAALVIRDNYGASKQQHTFTLRVLASNGYMPLEPGTQILRKGRNIYRNRVMRKPWPDESARLHALREKHMRGTVARQDRQARRQARIDDAFRL